MTSFSIFYTYHPIKVLQKFSEGSRQIVTVAKKFQIKGVNGRDWAVFFYEMQKNKMPDRPIFHFVIIRGHTRSFEFLIRVVSGGG